jgi:FkbM family methyltransferase
MTVYYSQDEEDRFLYEHFFSKYTFPGQKYFFEMGAMDGVTYSNTKFYEDSLQWTGLLVEPNPILYAQLLENRPSCLSMGVLVSNHQGPLDFRICKVGAVSSVATTTPGFFQETFYNHHRTVTRRMIPVDLTTVLRKSGFPRIDFMSVDVEGHEMEVLESFDFSIPTVLWLLEALEEDAEKQIKDFMEAKQFCDKGRFGRNLIFIHESYLQYFDI